MILKNKYFYASVLWAAVILIVAITPGSEISKVNQSLFTAKIAHFGEFFIFGWLLSKSFSGLKNPFAYALGFLGQRVPKSFPSTDGMIRTQNKWQLVQNPLLIAIFWGAFTESLQLFVPGRSFEFSDIVLNGVGSLCAVHAYQYIVAKPINRVV